MVKDEVLGRRGEKASGGSGGRVLGSSRDGNDADEEKTDEGTAKHPNSDFPAEETPPTMHGGRYGEGERRESEHAERNILPIPSKAQKIKQLPPFLKGDPYR